MRFLRLALVTTVAALAAAQQPSFDVPLTYFVGANGSNQAPFASPSVVVVGPGGDIWVAGVAQGPGLPILDPDEKLPSEDSCYARGGEPPSPFEPGVVLDPCPDLFVMRLAADGSGARFVKYVGRSGREDLAGGAVDDDGNFYLFGTRARASRPFIEGYRIKVGPDGETLEEQLVMFLRATGVGIDTNGVVYHANYAWINFDGLGPGPDETWTIVTGEPEDETAQGYTVNLNRKTGGTVRAEDMAVSPDGWVYVCGVMRFPDFDITWPLAVDPQDKDGDIFLAAISPQGELAWTTSYGGSDAESSPRIALSSTGEVVVVGGTGSADLPLQSSNAPGTPGNDDYFLFGVDAATGQRLYSGYLTNDDVTMLGDLASAPDGSIYLSVTATDEQGGEEGQIDLLLKINREGELVREARAGASAIAVTNDRRVVTVGPTKSGLLDAGGFLYGPQSVYVAFLDLENKNVEKPWLAAVMNAGDSVPAVLSPGAVVSLYGERLGPAEGAAVSIEAGKLPTQAAGVRVLVGDTPAPLLYVSATQINAILPFDLGGDPMARVVVERDGVRGNVFTMTVVEAAPGPFQQAPPNVSFGAILNQDGALNSPANPAPAGSVVAMWASGLGRFTPPPVDGEIVATVGPFPSLESEIAVEIGGIPAEIRYAGAAPGLAAGIAQINFVVPAGIAPDRALVQIRAGGRQSYPTSYLALRP